MRRTCSTSGLSGCVDSRERVVDPPVPPQACGLDGGFCVCNGPEARRARQGAAWPAQSSWPPCHALAHSLALVHALRCVPCSARWPGWCVQACCLAHGRRASTTRHTVMPTYPPRSVSCTAAASANSGPAVYTCPHACPRPRGRCSGRHPRHAGPCGLPASAGSHPGAPVWSTLATTLSPSSALPQPPALPHLQPGLRAPTWSS